MSRNRGEGTCAWCDGEIACDEPARPINDTDCKVYFTCGYAGLLVANATCVDCGAQYLAWIDGSMADYRYPDPDPEHPVRDTSFRSTFNDEPGVADFPKFAIKRGVIERIPWSDEVAKDQRYSGYWEPKTK